MNPLVIDKISKRFYFYKDSGFIYTKQLLKSFPDNYRFSWLVPDQVIKNKNNEIDWFKEAHPNIDLLPYPYPTSIHRNRYDFYGKNILDLFPYSTDIDFVINNQPELAGGIRTLFDTAKREKPVIFNYYHWIDCEESRRFGEDLGGYFYREMEGFINADFSCFHNPYAFSLFKKEFENRFGSSGQDFSEIKDEKVLYFKPAATEFGKKPFDLSKLNGKKIVLFNHRLNQTTQWKEVVSVFEEIYKERQDFVLWMTDAANKESARLVKSHPFVHVEQMPFENYGFLMNESHFAICNHKGYSTWNMAAIDSIFNNCFTLIPKREVYIDMFGDCAESDSFFHENKKDLKKKCVDLLDKDKASTEFIVSNPKLNHLFEPNDEIFNKKLLEAMLKRCENKTAKYDDAINLIKTNSSISKKDLINSLWSFHCNSNFQKMRWRFVLRDEIIDDTKTKETIYKIKQDGK
jgi:hypothetical protein